MAGLVYRNICRLLGDGAEFRNFNLEIDDGEFVALVGGDNCGKNELIRMAEGFGGTYDGEVYVNDRKIPHFDHGVNGACNVNDMSSIATPRRIISKQLKLMRVSDQEIDQRISSAAAELGATEAMDTRFAKLSPEMKLRAGMTRALALRAKVVLFAEPLNGMDSRAAARMRLAIMELHRRTGAAFVMATNSGNTAMALAGRIIVMDAGRIRQSDTPQNIYDYPADRFVAEYFGSALINIFPVSFVSANGQTYVEFGNNRMLMPAGKLSKIIDAKYLSGKTLMGVRPENIHYEQAFISVSPESAVDAIITHIELAGSDTYLHIALEGVNGDIIARVDPRCIAFPGDSITLAIDTNRVHFFDAATDYTILKRL